MRGCIIKRGKKWAFVVEAGKHPVTGRRRQKWRSGFATKAEAEAELAKTLAAMGQGMKVPNPTNETVASYFANWLTYKKQYVRPGTYSTYGWLVNYHIVPRLGSIKLGKLLQRFTAFLTLGLLVSAFHPGIVTASGYIEYLAHLRNTTLEAVFVDKGIDQRRSFAK